MSIKQITVAKIDVEGNVTLFEFRKGVPARAELGCKIARIAKKEGVVIGLRFLPLAIVDIVHRRGGGDYEEVNTYPREFLEKYKELLKVSDTEKKWHADNVNKAKTGF